MDDVKVIDNLMSSGELEFAVNQELIQQSALAYLGGGMAEIAIG